MGFSHRITSMPHLTIVSSLGHNEVVKMLLDKGADVNAQGGDYGNALQAASARGYEQVVETLLDKGADVNKQGGLYSNALNAAAVESHIATLELLLKNSADVSRHDSQRKSVLHHATNSADCRLSLVELLLSKGAPANTIDIENMTPLHYSVKFGHKCIVRLLLDNGVSVDTRVYRKSWSRNTVRTDTLYQLSVLESESESESEPNVSCMSAGLTPLHFAALTGNLVMTKFLLERGADPNALSGYNESPMHLTLRKTLHGPKYDDGWTDPHCRVECVWDFVNYEAEDDIDAVSAGVTKHRERVLDALLADTRTSLTIRDCHHEHPLHCVEYGKSGSVSLIQKLVCGGANPYETNLKQQNALHLASRAGDHDAVAFLLSLRVEPALTENKGFNALHLAAQGGNHEPITVLLETDVATRPSLVASKDISGKNSLHHLLSRTFNVRIETVQLLLNKGVDSSELDVSGVSPLVSYLKGYGLGINVGICRLMLSDKGNSSFVDKDGQNLGHLYASTLECKVQVLKILREHGVDLTQKDLQSRTILHCSAISGSITEESLHYLLYVVSVPINAEDASGKTALQHATEMAWKDYSPHIYDSGRWERSTRLLSEPSVSQVASRAVEG
jgi:ankyrin repeat protein